MGFEPTALAAIASSILFLILSGTLGAVGGFRAAVFFGAVAFFGATGFVFLAGAFLGKDCIRSCICFMISAGIVGAVILLVGDFGLGAERTRRLVGAALTDFLILLRLPPRIIKTYQIFRPSFVEVAQQMAFEVSGHQTFRLLLVVALVIFAALEFGIYRQTYLAFEAVHRQTYLASLETLVQALLATDAFEYQVWA